MTTRKLVIPGWLIALIGGLLLVYSVTAELVGFDVVTLRAPGDSIVNHRLWECALLWTILCSAAGSAIHFRSTPSHHAGRAWPIILVPLAIGVWLGAAEVVSSYDDLFKTPPAPIWWIVLFVGVHPAYGPFLAFALAWQSRIWKRRVKPPGHCRRCDYDLTGNESGRCPECGEAT